METNAIFTNFCRSRINLKLRKRTTAGWFFLLLFLAGNKETALQQKGVKYVVSSPCSLVWLLPSIMCYLVNDWKHKFSWDPLKPYSLFAVKKLLSAAGSSDSLCTWRDRYAGSCAADPGASQNGLSVGKKKEKLRFLYFCQTVRKTDMNVLSLCVSTEHTVYRIWKQRKKRCGDKRTMRLTKVSERRCAFFYACAKYKLSCRNIFASWKAGLALSGTLYFMTSAESRKKLGYKNWLAFISVVILNHFIHSHTYSHIHGRSICRSCTAGAGDHTTHPSINGQRCST